MKLREMRETLAVLKITPWEWFWLAFEACAFASVVIWPEWWGDRWVRAWVAIGGFYAVMFGFSQKLKDAWRDMAHKERELADRRVEQTARAIGLTEQAIAQGARRTSHRFDPRPCIYCGDTGDCRHRQMRGSA